MSTAAAFETVAATYDRDFGENQVAKLMRARVWREVACRLPESATVLDLGCGTGLDACELARRGHLVIAADGSPAMLAEAREKTERAGLASSVELVEVDLNDRDSRRSFFSKLECEAVLSDFGALNCIRDLESFAYDLKEILPVGGLLVAVVMGRVYPLEIAYHFLKARPARALERLRRGPVSVSVAGQSLPVQYYSPRRFCRILSPWFRSRHVTGLGTLLPPPYLARRFEGFETSLAALDRLEARLGSHWPLHSLGDHFLAILEKT